LAERIEGADQGFTTAVFMCSIAAKEVAMFSEKDIPDWGDESKAGLFEW
jgi:hypothetical protein